MNTTKLKNLKRQAILVFTKNIWQKFPEAEIFLVGGTVRDILLGLDTKDYDIIIRNVKPKDLEITLKELGIVNLVGKHFGVFKFAPKGLFAGPPHNKAGKKESLDITLPRTEHSLGKGGGYRDFKVQTDYKMPIKKDLSRRDFTINAMAFNLKTGELIDLFNGLKDLKQKKIKSVGDPGKRFKEDYSRMLRAIRFSCQLNFSAKSKPARFAARQTSGWKIEKNTWQSVKKLIGHINDKRNGQRIVPHETIAKEILKAFYYNPLMAMDLLDKSGAFKKLMPEVLKMKKCPQPSKYHAEGNVWRHTELCLKNLGSKEYKKEFGNRKPDAELIFGLLFHDVGKPDIIQYPKNQNDRIHFNGHDINGAKIAKQICRRLKLSSLPKDGPLRLDCDRLAWLVQHHMLLVSKKINAMRASKIAKYFFDKKYPGDNLLRLGYVDAISSIPLEGKPNPTGYYDMLGRIKELKKMTPKRKVLPKPLVSGYDIMENFKLKPGPEVGRLLGIIREEQLSRRVKTKKQALDFLKRKSCR